MTPGRVYTLKDVIATGILRPAPLEVRTSVWAESHADRRYVHRLLGYAVVAHERPYGLLLIAEGGNVLRNWTVRHEDAEWFAATWERS